MIRQQREATWPLTCILIWLFFLSAASPHVWQRVVRGQAAAEAPGSPDSGVILGRPIRSDSGGKTAALPSAAEQPAEQPADIAVLNPTEKAVQPTVSSSDPEPLRPSQLVYEAAPHEDVMLPGDTEGPRVLSPPPRRSPAPKRLPLVADARATLGRLQQRDFQAWRYTSYPDAGTTPPGQEAPDKQPDPPSMAGNLQWQEPEVLLERLEDLAAADETRRWATAVDRAVRQLGSAISQPPDRASSILEHLEESASAVDPLAHSITDRRLATRLRRAGHALRRRVDVWRQIVRIGDPEPAADKLPPVDPQQMSLCLAEIEALTADSPEGKAWREYLLVDALRELSLRRRSRQNRRAQQLAQQALRRITQTPLSAPQREFLSSEPVAALGRELRLWAAEPVDASRLLRHMEQYERTGLAADGRLLAQDIAYLELSPDDRRSRLGRQLNAHYRNANLRTAVTETLLNRLIPEPDAEVSPVRETVLGVPVRGQRVTFSDVAMRLLPHPTRAQMALEITGLVSSQTSSTSGPATFYNNSDSTFIARKPMELDLKGIHLWPAEVEVHNQTRLRGLQTDFDGIPLFERLVKGVARSKHDQKRPAANREIKRKIARRAKQRIDSEAGARLGKVTQRLQQGVISPMNALSLGPTMIQAQTTGGRLTMRLRVAGEDQLGGHTPRPRAPSDSLASLQLHESVLNNGLDRLELAGRTFTLPELNRHLATRLNICEPLELNPVHNDVKITFAKHNPLVVRFQEDQVIIKLAIARLSKARRRWKDFQVRAFYRPQVEGRSVKLTRQSVIHLIGRRLNAGSQIALRGIFAKAFSRKRPWQLTPERMIDHPELSDLAVTQFVVDDGWIGAALGPKRTAQRQQVQRRF